MNRIELHKSTNGKWYFRTFRSSDIIADSQLYPTKQKTFQGMFAEAEVMFDACGYELPMEVTLAYVDMTGKDEAIKTAKKK